MLAAKYFDDVYYTNAFYADVGGINPDELNMLEVDFLCKICFNLYVTPQEYQKYYDNLKEHCSFPVSLLLPRSAAAAAELHALRRDAAVALPQAAFNPCRVLFVAGFGCLFPYGLWCLHLVVRSGVLFGPVERAGVA